MTIMTMTMAKSTSRRCGRRRMMSNMGIDGEESTIWRIVTWTFSGGPRDD